MKKILYWIPAIVICLLYVLLTILVGGISGFQPVVLLYIGAPILAAALLTKEKWWGCVPGFLVGIYLIWMSNQYTGQVIDLERPLGILFLVYYCTMGILCKVSQKKK